MGAKIQMRKKNQQKNVKMQKNPSGAFKEPLVRQQYLPLPLFLKKKKKGFLTVKRDFFPLWLKYFIPNEFMSAVNERMKLT